MVRDGVANGHGRQADDDGCDGVANDHGRQADGDGCGGVANGHAAGGHGGCGLRCVDTRHTPCQGRELSKV